MHPQLNCFTVPQDLPAEQTQLLIVESVRELQKNAAEVFRRIEQGIEESTGTLITC